MDPEFKSEVIALAKTIDEMDYYQILRVKPKAFTEEIKNSYFKQSRKFHPDKFYSEDPNLQEMVNKIFKRITEAYKVLSDQDKRAAYSQGINSDERTKFLRYSAKKLEHLKNGGPEDEGQTPMGKKYYQMAKSSMQNKDYKSARINLQLAAKMEPANQTFKKRLAECEEMLKIKKKKTP